MFTSLFFIRFVIVVFSIYFQWSAMLWWFDPIYYLLFELVAISFMFLVFRAHPKSSDKRPGELSSATERAHINRDSVSWYSKGTSSDGI